MSGLLRILESKRIQFAITLMICIMIISAGSIAWFSATQKALNAFSFNPDGVNLHDDFTDPNKDIYVENTGFEPVIVRIKLKEYMEIGKDINAPGNAKKSSNQTDTTDKWHAHNGITNPDECESVKDNNGDDFEFHEYWEWIMGGEPKWYVPANDTEIEYGSEDWETSKDGRKPVVQKAIRKDGLPEFLYSDEDSPPAGKYNSYIELDDAIKDALSDEYGEDMLDKLEDAKYNLLAAIVKSTGDGPDQTEIDAAREALYKLQAEINEYTRENFHGLQLTRPATVLTITEWLNGDGNRAGQTPGDYWVVDNEDGWCYWAAPLEPGEATGLLLNAVNATSETAKLKKDRKRYYYGIDVTMQAATADDVKQFWNSEHPDIMVHGAASTEAQILLNTVAEAIDLTAGSGVTQGRSARSAVVAEEIQKGEYWYLSGDTWKFYDGRWRYDGMEWTLDNEPYPFETSKWFMSYGEWNYADGEWFFNGSEWIYYGEDSQIEEPPPKKEQEEEPPPESSEADPDVGGAADVGADNEASDGDSSEIESPGSVAADDDQDNEASEEGETDTDNDGDHEASESGTEKESAPADPAVIEAPSSE